MGKAWVLDTETKGTGAEMVPLEKTKKRSTAKARRPVSAGKPKPRPAPPPAPREPHLFRIVDVMTRRVLAEDADARRTLDVLEGIRSVVDIRIYVRQSKETAWRPLTMAEIKLMWRSARE